jgi:hypothetical protein
MESGEWRMESGRPGWTPSAGPAARRDEARERHRKRNGPLENAIPDAWASEATPSAEYGCLSATPRIPVNATE